MKSLFEELGGTYTLGKDGMYYPNLMIEEADQRPIGKWGRMHKDYLEEKHPGLYQRHILNGTLGRHLADADERATAMLDQNEQYSQPSRRDCRGRSYQYHVSQAAAGMSVQT